MPNVIVNDKPISIADDCSLKKILEQLQYSQGFYAVAVNKTVISQSQYAQTILHEGDCVEVLAPMVGG